MAPRGGLARLTAPLLAVAAVACSPDSGGYTDVGDTSGCSASACTSYCTRMGHAWGRCDGGRCLCEGEGDAGDGSGDADGADVPPRTTRMVGTVWSPGRLVPISGALIYFALREPDPIPSGAYPETCVDPPTPFFTRSAPDGTFALEVLPGTYRLAVQKGQFRRVRDITVPEDGGPVTIPDEPTTLPSGMADGDTIPHMALVWAIEGGDHIEDVLAKLTMGDVDADHRLSRGTEQFDMYNVLPYPANTVLLEDLDRMLSYHIIFFPCTISDYFGEQIGDPTAPLSNPNVLDNIRAFVDAGGKVYATDMMYDIFEQPTPVYVDICGDDATIDAGDREAWAHSETASGWTSHGRSIDPDLSAWLDAIGIAHDDIDFLQNFVWIEGMLETPEPRPGEPMPPKTWVDGDFILRPGVRVPLTITFPYGAGKVLFSTYHTVGDAGGSPGHSGIYPQEYVLLYLIMEIGVCETPIT